MEIIRCFAGDNFVVQQRKLTKAGQTRTKSDDEPYDFQ